MAASADILAQLQAQARPEQLAGMARYGMTIDNRLGVKVPEMRRIAKAIGRDHLLAGELWATGIAEARIVASMIASPDSLTADEMEAWVQALDSWDVCDQVCMNLFARSPLARSKIEAWAAREETFVKRAAFALIACLATRDKQAADETCISWLALIKAGATDERNFVKKAVNWALREIGKRNAPLNTAAIATAHEIRQLPARSARWIAADALRELTGDKVQQRLRPP